jgi:aspartate/tyrosine/aromatic aminotransferase
MEELKRTPLLDALERARAALPDFRQQDDYLLAHGASLMSEASHEIIHTDTLTKIVLAVLSASLVQGTEATAGGGASYPTPEKNPTPAYRPAGVAPSDGGQQQ